VRLNRWITWTALRTSWTSIFFLPELVGEPRELRQELVDPVGLEQFQVAPGFFGLAEIFEAVGESVEASRDHRKDRLAS
jgi:hypothetical protein